MKLMLDSSFLIGLILEDDQWHELADSLSYNIEQHTTYITNVILSETMNSFKCLGGKMCNNIYNYLTATNKILYLNNISTCDNSIELLLKYDASIGFSDCTTIEMMRQNNIRYIVSYDSDFDKKEDIVRIYNYKENNKIKNNINI